MLPQSKLSMVRWIRWIARGISIFIAAFWFLILLQMLTYDVLVGAICLEWEMGLLAGLVICTILSVLAAWWNDGFGGILMILWGVAFAWITLSDQLFSAGECDLDGELAISGRWKPVYSKLGEQIGGVAPDLNLINSRFCSCV